MECRACGAALREDARFCNVCGASQGDALTAGPVPPASTDGGGESVGASGRARRPPRVPRASDAADEVNAPAPARSLTVPVATNILDEAALDAAQPQPPAPQEGAPSTAEAHDTELAEPELVEPAEEGVEEEARPLDPTTGSIAVEEASGAAIESEGVRAESPSELEHMSPLASSKPDVNADHARSTPPLGTLPVQTAGVSVPPESRPESDQAWEDADTVEYNAVAARAQPLDSSAQSEVAPTPSPDDLARPRGDGLSWPLPESIIVGGRYRVEETLTATADAPGAENMYRVRDLQGYERCWSCGAEYDATPAGDRFCQECGADMLARDFLMYERRESTTAQTSEPAAGDLPDVTSEGDQSAGETARVFTQGARVYRVVPRIAEPVLFPRGVRVVAAMATDTGASRAGEENEDSAGILTLSVGHDSRIEPLILCVVADGLGGHASGQLASRLAVRLLMEHVMRTVAQPFVASPAPIGDDQGGFGAGMIRALTDGIEAANKTICARNRSSGADMGSTCVAALIHRDIAYVANAGDSRAYVLEDGSLRRVTTDHSLVEQLVAGGLITPEERYTHPQRNQIFRSLGDEPDVPLDTFTQKLRPGMRLLLCSDGVWEMVRDDEMAHILSETASPQQACDLLIHAANEHGGEDNLSAVVVDISA